MSIGKTSEWERSNVRQRETESMTAPQPSGPRWWAGAQALGLLGHTGALFPSVAVLLCEQRLPIQPVPGAPAASSSAAGCWASREACSLSLIGIETHSPPFSCRWGFHRKKLLLCFPSLATVWKSDPHILLYWVKSLLDRLLSIIGWSGPADAPVLGLPWQSYWIGAGTSRISSDEDGLA